MQYTKYFSFITKENGQLQLSSTQFCRMMNIVHLEGAIKSLLEIKESNKSEFYKYDLKIRKRQIQLTDLTGNLTPQDLIKDMHRFNN